MEPVFEESAICQLCLQVDIKVHKLNDKYHAFIESILKLKQSKYVLSENIRICYICMALLTKAYKFLQTIWNAQEIVCMLKYTGSITKSSLKTIDRDKIGLNPINLSSLAIICQNEVLYNGFESQTLYNNSNLEIEADKDHSNKSQIIRNSLSKLTSCIMAISSSEDEFEDLNVSNETAIDISLEDDDNTKDPLLSISKKSSHYTVNMGTKDNTQTAPPKQKKKVPLKQKPRQKCILKSDYESESSSEDERQQLKKDGDYRPDSTSHSEDSAYDEYNDEGKKNKEPKVELEYPRKCDHCNYEVPQRRHHYRHYLFVHPDIPYPYRAKNKYACSICGKLVRIERLKGHEKNHIVAKVKCLICPKIFRNTKSMRCHVLHVHPKKTLICDYCSKEFKTRTDIMRHLRIHEGIKPYKCYICDAAFVHLGNRNTHIRSAHQNNKYVPKKRAKAQTARRKNKQDSSDSELSSTTVKRKRTKKPRSSSGKKSKIVKVTSNKKLKGTKKKNKNQIGDFKASKMMDDAKENRKKNKNVNIEDNNIDKQNEDNKITMYTDSGSDDELLSEVKRKQTPNE